ALTAAGQATIAVGSQSTSVQVSPIVPTLFSMNGNGAGVAAATAIRVPVPNPNVSFPVQVFQCDASGHCTSVPIDVGLDTPVYVSLYGTGIRGRSSLANVKVTIHGTPVQVLYAGAQGQYPGLDQVNIGLPLSLRGAGESDVVVTVDGQVANTVT